MQSSETIVQEGEGPKVRMCPKENVLFRYWAFEIGLLGRALDTTGLGPTGSHVSVEFEECARRKTELHFVDGQHCVDDVNGLLHKWNDRRFHALIDGRRIRAVKHFGVR